MYLCRYIVQRSEWLKGRSVQDQNINRSDFSQDFLDLHIVVDRGGVGQNFSVGIFGLQFGLCLAHGLWRAGYDYNAFDAGPGVSFRDGVTNASC